jgi:hypothetical protein
MIVRILGEGQYDVADERIGELNELDDRLLSAVESDDAVAFAPALHALLDAVRRVGNQVVDHMLVASDLVLPDADADLARVRSLLSDEGLIPD